MMTNGLYAQSCKILLYSRESKALNYLAIIHYLASIFFFSFKIHVIYYLPFRLFSLLFSNNLHILSSNIKCRFFININDKFKNGLVIFGGFSSTIYFLAHLFNIFQSFLPFFYMQIFIFYEIFFINCQRFQSSTSGVCHLPQFKNYFPLIYFKNQ